MQYIQHENLSNQEQRILGAKYISPGKYRCSADKVLDQLDKGFLYGYVQNRGGHKGGPKIDRSLVNDIKENLQPLLLGDFTWSRNGVGFEQADAHNRIQALKEIKEEGTLPEDLTLIMVFTPSGTHTDTHTAKKTQRSHTAAQKYKNTDYYYGSQLMRIATLLYQTDNKDEVPNEFWSMANNLTYAIECFRQKIDMTSFYRMFSVRSATKKVANVSAEDLKDDYLSDAQIIDLATAVSWWLSIKDLVDSSTDEATRYVMKGKSFAGLMLLQSLRKSKVGKMSPETVAERIQARNMALYNNAVALTAGARDRSERAEAVVLEALEKRLPPNYYKHK